MQQTSPQPSPLAIEKAEQLVDAIISSMQGDLAVIEVYSRTLAFCTSKSAEAWFHSHFSFRGWEVLIGGRLLALGFRQGDFKWRRPEHIEEGSSHT